MRIEARTATTYQLTVHAYELASLIAAARWAAEGGKGELPNEARDNLRALVSEYEAALEQATRSAPPRSGTASSDLTKQ